MWEVLTKYVHHNIIGVNNLAHGKYMNKKTQESPILDEYEQDIENNFEHLQPVKNLEQRMLELKQAAKTYIHNKKSIAL